MVVVGFEFVRDVLCLSPICAATVSSMNRQGVKWKIVFLFQLCASFDSQFQMDNIYEHFQEETTYHSCE